MATLRLIVGLGNPGERYARTRHNAGVWFLEALGQQYSVDFRSETKFSGMVGRIQAPPVNCFLLFPTTFMNLSGQAVQAICRFYQIAPEEVLVVHDEIDLPVGTVRLKQGGGHGGHNGLRDIISHIGKDFWRLRLGVGHPGNRQDVIDYVLKAPGKADEAAIDECIVTALQYRDDLFAMQMQKVMNALHQRK